jgi:hypothetical protein
MDQRLFTEEGIIDFRRNGIAVHMLVQYDAAGECTGEQVLMSRAGNPHVREKLPLPPLNRDNPLPFARFALSPDGQTLLADRKIGSGINEVFEFRRINGLRYGRTYDTSLNHRVVRQFKRPRERRNGTGINDDAEFVLFQRWLSGGKEALLICLFGERNSQRAYTVILDTASGRFREFRKASERTFTAWPEPS